MGDEFSFEDILIIFKRRLAYFLVPAIILAPLLIIGVMLLPSKYTSRGVLLIESPQISENLVKGASGSKAPERIEITRQRIIAREELLRTADRTNLFAGRPNLSETKKVKKMRKNLSVKAVQDRVITASNNDAVVFQVSYTDRDPEIATAVANDLINQFEVKDRSNLAKGASDNVEFFEAEVTKVRGELAAKQQEIATFKQENTGRLPEQLPLHERQLERINSQLGSLETQIGAIEEDKRFVNTQMASAASGGGNENSPEARVLRLKGDLEELRARYTNQHPDVIKLQNEIRALERQLAPGRTLQNLQKQLDDAVDELDQAQRDGADEETLSTLSKNVDRISDRFIREAGNAKGLSSSAELFILQSSLVSLQKRGRSFEDRRQRLQARADDLEDRITATPQVASVLEELERDLKSLNRKLEQGNQDLSITERAENLQSQNRAERITTVEAASVPEKPSSPNRPALVFVALLFSMMAGALIAIGFEFLNSTIRGRGHLTSIIDEPPLAIIPYIPNGNEKAFTMPFSGLRQGLGRANNDAHKMQQEAQEAKKIDVAAE